MELTDERTCKRTGAHLVRYQDLTGVQICKNEYLGWSGAPRTSGDDPAEWNRWDVPPQTFYYAAEETAAFSEVLAPFRVPNGAGNPLVRTAELLGTHLDELVETMAAEDDFLDTGVIPASWRERRGIYYMRLPTDGWWVDVEHGDTLVAVDRLLRENVPGTVLANLGVHRGLDLSHVTGPNRDLTTLIASTLHTAQLYDDSWPLGVQYPSRWGYGPCWAVWSDAEEELAVDTYKGEPRWIRTIRLPMVPAGGGPIEATNPALLKVANEYGLTIL